MRSTALLMGALFCLGLLASACSTGERPAMDQNQVAESPMQVPVIPNQTTSPALVEPSETPGEVQERGVQRVLPEGLSSGMPQLSASLGDVAFQIVKKGYYYITAINGGRVDPNEGPLFITMARERESAPHSNSLTCS